MDRNIERRATLKAGARRKLRTPMQAVSALALMGVAFAWASQRPLGSAQPGSRLAVPAAIISAPSGSPQFRYLADALGEDEARRLEPITERVAAVLARYAKDPAVVDRAAAAVVAEGEKHNLDPSLLVGLMIIENSRIEPTIKSNVGATGLMQVMPFHSGKWGCDSPNLANIEANICHGVNILAQYVRTSPNLDRALLRYNGCVRGTNTPNCHTYPKKVKGWAQHTQLMMNAVEEGRDVRSVALIPRLNLSTPKAAPKKAVAKKAVAKKAPAKAPVKRPAAKSTRRVASR